MIISHKHKFIFIKTQKTAGTSIEIALSKICGPKDIITPISDKDEKKRIEIAGRGAQNYNIPFRDYSKFDLLRLIVKGKRLKYFNHMNAETVRKYIGEEIWSSYYKFTFERNPYDKVLSLYYYTKQNEKFTINEFIQNKSFVKLRGYDQYSIDGIPAVDKIYKIEDLENEMNDISKVLNLDNSVKIPTYRAKGGFRKSRIDYKELLNEEDKKVIDLFFARELKLMNYQF